VPVWRLQTSWAKDSISPRDRMVITPHFNDIGATTDPQNLCNDWLAALQAITATTGELRVTAYDAQGSKPVYPQGDAIVFKGVTQATSLPRELAVCLSFYSERNVPRQRGRLYLPGWFVGIAAPGLRPPSSLPKIEQLAQAAQDLGGPDVDWCVYSRATDAARSVTNWWYDNEWDVQRSRGLTGSGRVLGTTSEQGTVRVALQAPDGDG
jgi:hypothetical protein